MSPLRAANKPEQDRAESNAAPAGDVTGGETDGRVDASETSRIELEHRVFHSILSSIKDYVYTFDRRGRFLYVNQAMLDLLGLKYEEVIGKTMADLGYSTDVEERLFQDVNTVFETKRVVRSETYFTDPSGGGGYYENVLSPVFADDGEVEFVSGSSHSVTRYKRVEKILGASEERFRLAQRAGRIGVWDWDAVSGQTYWSEMMWDLYGEDPNLLNPDEDFWSAHLHPLDRAGIIERLSEAVSSDKNTYRDQFRSILPTGEIRWIESLGSIDRNDSGRALRMYGVNLDVTERKRAEEQLRHSEYQLRLVMDSVPALIAYVDSQKKFRLVNRKYAEWHGCKPEDILGRRMRQVIGSTNYKAIKPYLEQALDGTSCQFETTLNYSAVGKRFVQISYVPDVSGDDVVTGIFVLVNDLTDRKRSEDLLRSSEERLRSLMESFTDYAIFSMDVEGVIVSWNTGAEKTFGYAADEIIGQSCELLFTAEDVAKSVPIKEMRNARKNGRTIDDRWHVRKDGALFYASGETTPLYIGKSLVGYAKIARDLTERRRYAEDLQQARDELEVRVANRTRELAEANLMLLQQIDERANAERQRFQMLRKIFTIQEDERGRIARDIHDQLGQRLTALRLKIASLKDLFADDQTLIERVDRLQEIAERLDSEVSFLAWELRPSILDDLDFVDALENYVSEWSRHSDIISDFQAVGIRDIEIDRDIEANLYRITQEALNNVGKYAKADKVNVVIEKHDDELILIIEDNGVGFVVDDLSDTRKLSESFGLVSMRERAALVSGTMDIESAVGSGTTVFVRVPLNQGSGN